MKRIPQRRAAKGMKRDTPKDRKLSLDLRLDSAATVKAGATLFL